MSTTNAPTVVEGIESGTIVPKAEFDIFTKHVAKFLDPQFVIYTIGSFISDKEVYEEAALNKICLDIVKHTRLLDLWEEYHKKVYGEDAPLSQELLDAQNSLPTDKLKHIQACGPLLDIIGHSDEYGEKEAELRDANRFDIQVLKSEFGVTDEHLDALLHYAKFLYDCGEDGMSSKCLHIFQELKYPEYIKESAVAKNPELYEKMLWGQFAIIIMDQHDDWSVADDKRKELSRIISDAADKKKISDLQELQQYTWLFHWSLFLLADHDSNRDDILSWYCQEKNLNMITIACPWLLRYIIVASILQKDRSPFNSIVKNLITPETRAMGDPFVDFVGYLLVDFDFPSAQSALRDCLSAIAMDKFLDTMTNYSEFINAARGIIFDVFASVHSKIDLNQLADQLGLSVEDAERWVTHRVTSRLKAKVDSQSATVEIVYSTHSLHDNIANVVKDAVNQYCMVAGWVDGAISEERTTESK